MTDTKKSTKVLMFQQEVLIMAKTRKTYSAQFKRQALEACTQPDATVAQVARQLGIDPSLIYKWRAQDKDKQDHAFPGQGNPHDDELARLKQENAQLRKERDFLKLAAAYFAKG